MSNPKFDIDRSIERSKTSVAWNALAEAVIQLVDSERSVRKAAANYEEGSALRDRLDAIANQLDQLGIEVLTTRRLVR